MSDTTTKDARHSKAWESFKEVYGTEHFGSMNDARRTCVVLLRSDLYRLDDDESEEAGGPYDSATKWRYMAPGRAFLVALEFGESSLLATVTRKDGTVIASTDNANGRWLDEVLP